MVFVFSFFEAVEHHLRHENIIQNHLLIRKNAVIETWQTYATNEDDGIVYNINSALFDGRMDSISKQEKFQKVIAHCNRMREDGVFAEAEFIRGIFQLLYWLYYLPICHK